MIPNELHAFKTVSESKGNGKGHIWKYAYVICHPCDMLVAQSLRIIPHDYAILMVLIHLARWFRMVPQEYAIGGWEHTRDTQTI